MGEVDAEPVRTRRGDRFVLAIYVCLVAITGVFGYVIGLVRPENLDPELFGVIQLPPTPAGVALYGMVTVGTLLGVLLYAVDYVSDRYDTADVRDEPSGERGPPSSEQDGGDERKP